MGGSGYITAAHFCCAQSLLMQDVSADSACHGSEYHTIFHHGILQLHIGHHRAVEAYGIDRVGRCQTYLVGVLILPEKSGVGRQGVGKRRQMNEIYWEGIIPADDLLYKYLSFRQLKAVVAVQVGGGHFGLHKTHVFGLKDTVYVGSLQDPPGIVFILVCHRFSSEIPPPCAPERRAGSVGC